MSARLYSSRLLERFESRPHLALGLILAFGLAVRLAVVLVASDYPIAYDSGDYARHARSIAAGDGFPESVFAAGGGPTAFRPPLYPYLLGGVYAIVGVDAGPTAGRIVGGLIGVIVVWLVYLIGKAIWGRRVGLLAALVTAAFPPLVFLNAALITEPIFLAIELALALAVLASRREGGDWRWAAAAGCLCGLAALTRSNGLLLVIPAAAGVWVARPRLSLRGLAAPATVLVAALLTILPWTARNTIAFDRLVPISTQSGFALAGAYNDRAREVDGYTATWVLPQQTRRYGALYRRQDLDEAELDRRLRDRAVDYALADPAFVLETTALNMLRTLNLLGVPNFSEKADRLQLGLGVRAAEVAKWSFYALGLIALLGIAVLIVRPKRRRGPPFLWWIPVLAIAAAVWIIGSTRYRIPAYPFMALLVAIALVDLLERFGRARARTSAADATRPYGQRSPG